MSAQTSSREVLYRGYRIYPGNTVFAAWHYAHEDYDGPEDGRCGTGATVEECKAEIDQALDREIIDTSCENCGVGGIDITVRLCPSCAFECPACRGQGAMRNGKDCAYCDASGTVTEQEAADWPLDRG